MATPVVIFLRCLGPILQIRYGFFFVDRIGHFSFDVEYYLSERELQEKKKNTVDVFFVVGKLCNEFLLTLTGRHVVLHPLVRLLYRAEGLIRFGGDRRVLPARLTNGSRDLAGILTKTKPHLVFSEEEDKRGCKALDEIGCTAGERIVCLVVRDSAYLMSNQKDRNWEYHNYRDTEIINYEAAALELGEMGYWVFRMGKTVRGEFQVNHPRIIDYANSKWRSDFLDIWLLSRCTFCIGTSTGLDSVADIFRKPIAFVNFLPLSYFQTWSQCVLAPAHLVWKNTGRKLSCREHLYHNYQKLEEYEVAGIQVQELSPQDVTGVVLEMEARLSGTWVDVPEMETRQVRFWDLFSAGGTATQNTSYVNPNARLSSTFIKSCPGFLD